MKCALFVTVFVLCGASTAAMPALGGQPKCGIKAETDPQYSQMKPIGYHTINLDLPPIERWKHLASAYSAELKDLVDTFKGIAGGLSKEAFKIIEALGKADADKLLDAMRPPYGDEIRGIAEAANLTKLDALVCNMVYEISGACTVIIAQSKDGRIIHGHNLDTAANWNFKTHQWVLAEKLRAITSNLNFTKGGKEVFRSTSYIGYAGVFEGMKPGAFSVSLNTRFDFSVYSALLKWITGINREGHFAAQVMRDALTYDEQYAQAAARMNTERLLGPGYLAVAGIKPGEGAILSRSANASFHVWTLEDELKKGNNFMVNTNWDHWLPDPIFDRRRVPAEACMKELDGANITFPDLFKVLAAKPTRNKMTCHSAMFSAATGHLESYQQYCDEPGCRPFMKEEMPLLV